jgi:hypothetical protein
LVEQRKQRIGFRIDQRVDALKVLDEILQRVLHFACSFRITPGWAVTAASLGTSAQARCVSLTYDGKPKTLACS